jgi:hypothetical protein
LNDSRVPSTLEPKVALILRWLDELRQKSPSVAAGIDPALLIPSQNPSVISILGDQGVGKSTTLRHLCDQLQDNPQRLVTPVVSPERFAEGDTLFGWVLSAITEILPERLPESSERKAPEYRPNLSIRELADLLRRQEALARKHHQASSVIRSAHPDEWADSMAAVTTAGLQLVRGWVALLNGLASDVDQVIIPVDDADSVPSLLNGVLRDLRWLTVHPLVAIVVCAKEEMLLHALVGDPELAMMESSARHRHSVGVLVKALPRHLRISIEPLGQTERLHFVPQGESESLIQVLDQCRVDSDLIGFHSLREFFELKLGDAEATSPYADLLPDNPRQLDHLWRRVRDIAASQREQDQTALVAKQIIETAIESAIDLVPNLPRNTIRFFEAEPQGLYLELDYSKIETAMSVGAGRTIFRTGDYDLAMRRVDGFLFQMVKQDAENAEAEPNGNLPPSFVMAHCLARDLADPEGSTDVPFLIWKSAGTLALPGGHNWEGSLEVRYQGERTDNRFAMVPDWDARYDYFLYTAGWNACWNVVKDFGPDPSPALLEWVLLKHFQLVVAVHEKRAIPASLIDSMQAQVEDLQGRWSPEEELSEFADAVNRLYHTEPSSIRDRDFVYWVNVYLARCADGVLGIPEFGETILDIREQVLKERGVLEKANQQCAEFLAMRVRRYISEDWTTKTIGLIDRFDEGLAQSLSQLHEVAREENDSELQALAATLEGRGLPASLVGELSLSGMTPELERQLRVAGLPGAAIATLAQRFPSPLQEGHAAQRQRSDPSRG